MSDDVVKAATEETRTLSSGEIRERIIALAFAGDRGRYQLFLDSIVRAIPLPVTVVIRGSAVTGVKWADGSPFDAQGPGTSDIDLTFVSGDMLKLYSEFHIPGLHSTPLSDEHPHAAPALVPLRRALCAIAGRPVNIQATTSLVQYSRDVLFDQPYFTLMVDGALAPEAMPGGEPGAG